jgi:hypothetical protein
VTTASQRLNAALLSLAARGFRSHCSDAESHHLWLSEHERERAVAVMLCDRCPVLTVCGDSRWSSVNLPIPLRGVEWVTYKDYANQASDSMLLSLLCAASLHKRIRLYMAPGSPQPLRYCFHG